MFRADDGLSGPCMLRQSVRHVSGESHSERSIGWRFTLDRPSDHVPQDHPEPM